LSAGGRRCLRLAAGLRRRDLVVASFAAEGELYGSAWVAVAGLAMDAAVSGMATVYIG
jgi:hypothetical protein